MLAALLEFIRGLVRPVITLFVVLSAIALVFLNIFYPVEIPDWYTTILGVVVTFWFVTRKDQNGNSV